MKFFKDIVTGKDNDSHDLGRWLGLLSFITGLGLEIYAVAWKGQPYDFTQFGLGVAAMAAGIGAMLKLKESTEP